jgi:hypothetical protein
METYSRRETAIGLAMFAVIATFMAWLAGADFSQLSGQGVAGFGLMLAAYFLPAISAECRGHHNATAILTLNLLLGWTGLGWMIAMVWAMTEPLPPPKAYAPPRVGRRRRG